MVAPASAVPRGRGDGRLHWELVVAYLRGEERPLLDVLPEENDREAFEVFLGRHLLGGLLHGELSARRQLSLLPLELARSLRAARLQQWAVSEAVLRDTREVSEALRGAGVEHLFLKGPLFGQEMHGDLDRRATGDVDVLVHERAVQAARACIRGLGFEVHPRWAGAGRVARRTTHHLDLRRGSSVVELHWTLRRQTGLRLTEASLWQGARVFRCGSHDYPVPSQEMTLCTLLLGFASDLELGTARLRSVADLYATASKMDAACDWSAFFHARRDEGIERLCTALLSLVGEMYPFAGTTRLGAELRARAGERFALLERGLEVFAPEPPAWRNKRLLFPLYGCSTPAAWSGWLASLPFRLALFEGR